MSVALAVLLQAASSPGPTADDANTVIVTAPSQAIEAAWAKCVAGGCTPRQDVVASIRYAEVQFRAGRYLDARHLLQDAIERDKRAAAMEPVAVAALYEATATVSLHEGDQDVATRASGARLRILRSAFGERDPRYLQAWLDDIDTHVGLKANGEYVSRYASLESTARAAGQPTVAAAAALRRAAWQHLEGNDYAAKRRLTALRERSAGNVDTGRAVDAMLARFASDHHDSKIADRLSAQAASPPGNASAAGAQPILIFQPRIPPPDDPDGLRQLLDAPGPPIISTADIHWADIAFLIEPDGHVSAPRIVRGAGGSVWAGPILGAIAKRRYTATTLPLEQRKRIERWTLTADYAIPSDSFVRRRSVRPHFVEIDVTSTEPTRVVAAKPAS